MEIFNQETIEKRKQKTSDALAPLVKNDEVVIVKAGEPIQMPGGHDQTYPFYPHPDYYWLTGFRRPRGISCYTLADGWIDFVDPVSDSERIWEGGSESLPGRDINEFEKWLGNRKYVVLAQGSSQNEFYDLEIQEAFNEVRRVKDPSEIELIKKAASFALAGYTRVSQLIKDNRVVGMSERALQVEYESAVLMAGSHKMPYESIVGAGERAAVLHATPTDRIVKKEDLILIDAGADIYDYCVDITRVFSASGKFSSRQQELYEIVKKAQASSIDKCQSTMPWHEVHLASAKQISQGLIDLKILNGSVESAIESGAVGLFFPHGVGHMVGLKVRDVGDRPRSEVKSIAGVRSRVGFNLKPGYVMTVEPGCYFIKELLNNPEKREQFRSEINFKEAEKWLSVGGVRLEDDILITDGEPENLTFSVAK